MINIPAIILSLSVLFSFYALIDIFRKNFYHKKIQFYWILIVWFFQLIGPLVYFIYKPWKRFS